MDSKGNTLPLDDLTLLRHILHPLEKEACDRRVLATRNLEPELLLQREIGGVIQIGSATAAPALNLETDP